jgi:hypothetical protein
MQVAVLRPSRGVPLTRNGCSILPESSAPIPEVFSELPRIPLLGTWVDKHNLTTVLHTHMVGFGGVRAMSLNFCKLMDR